ncbi:MAG: VWA domain-containing protein [Actinomycetota bacterium]
MSLSASLRFDHELLAVEREHRVHCMLELVAPAAPEQAKRPDLHIALVLDRSGSMSGPKLETAKACAGYLARKIKPTDELSIVTYDGEVQLAFPRQQVGTAGAALEQVIAGIGPGGSTNLSGGWLKGIEQLRDVPGGSGSKTVLLLTDGLANQGITDPEALVKMARSASDEDGVRTTTIGFGSDFDEILLTRMAEAGVGNGYYAENPDEAAGIFAQEFEGLASVIAQNLSVEIRPTDDVQLLGVLNQFPAVQVEGGIQVQLGDAYAQERRRIVFELHIPNVAALGVKTVADVIVRYVSVEATIEAHDLRLPVTVNMVSADEAGAAGPDADVVDEVTIMMSAHAKEEAREAADRGDFDTARDKLRSAAGELRRIAPDSARAQELLEEANRSEEHASTMDATTYGLTERKRMRYESWQAQRGRRQPPRGK